MTLVLSAFAGELAAFIETLLVKKKYKISLGTHRDIYYTCGLTTEGELVTAAVSGIGKLNSYIATYELINKCRPDRVIFTGISGAVSPELKIGDIILSDSITQYDMDYVSKMVLSGDVPAGPMEDLIHTDKNLTDSIETAVRNLQERNGFQRIFSERTLSVGCTGSADIFMTPEIQKRYVDIFTDREVLAVDMEGFSAGSAALVRDIPFAQLRIISDDAEGNKPAASIFREFLRSISCDLAAIIDNL